MRLVSNIPILGCVGLAAYATAQTDVAGIESRRHNAGRDERKQCYLLEALSEKVERLETRVGELESLILPMRQKLRADARRVELRRRFEQRVKKDTETYSHEELRDISSLYQVANPMLSITKADF